MEIIFLRKSPSNRWFRNGIHTIILSYTVLIVYRAFCLSATNRETVFWHACVVISCVRL